MSRIGYLGAGDDLASGFLRRSRPGRRVAKGFDVTGWVRNLPDGRVELQATGDEEEVRAFLDQLAQSELHSLIRKQTENKLNEPLAARGFEIRHD